MIGRVIECDGELIPQTLAGPTAGTVQVQDYTDNVDYCPLVMANNEVGEAYVGIDTCNSIAYSPKCDNLRVCSIDTNYVSGISLYADRVDINKYSASVNYPLVVANTSCTSITYDGKSYSFRDIGVSNANITANPSTGTLSAACGCFCCCITTPHAWVNSIKSACTALEITSDVCQGTTCICGGTICNSLCTNTACRTTTHDLSVTCTTCLGTVEKYTGYNVGQSCNSTAFGFGVPTFYYSDLYIGIVPGWTCSCKIDICTYLNYLACCIGDKVCATIVSPIYCDDQTVYICGISDIAACKSHCFVFEKLPSFGVHCSSITVAKYRISIPTIPKEYYATEIGTGSWCIKERVPTCSVYSTYVCQIGRCDNVERNVLIGDSTLTSGRRVASYDNDGSFTYNACTNKLSVTCETVSCCLVASGNATVVCRLMGGGLTICSESYYKPDITYSDVAAFGFTARTNVDICDYMECLTKCLGNVKLTNLSAHTVGSLDSTVNICGLSHGTSPSYLYYFERISESAGTKKDTSSWDIEMWRITSYLGYTWIAYKNTSSNPDAAVWYIRELSTSEAAHSTCTTCTCLTSLTSNSSLPVVLGCNSGYSLTGISSCCALTFNPATGLLCGTCFSGTAVKADCLATSRTINGTSFNGSANITTTCWGNTRCFRVQDCLGCNAGAWTSVNGTANACLALPGTLCVNVCGTSSNALCSTCTQRVCATAWSASCNRPLAFLCTEELPGNTHIGYDTKVTYNPSTLILSTCNVCVLNNAYLSGNTFFNRLTTYNTRALSASNANAPTATTGYVSMNLYQVSSAFTNCRPNGDGYILNFNWDNASQNWASQLFLPNSKVRTPQFRSYCAATGYCCWSDWDSFVMSKATCNVLEGDLCVCGTIYNGGSFAICPVTVEDYLACSDRCTDVLYLMY